MSTSEIPAVPGTSEAPVAVDAAGLEILSREACLRALAQGGLGRIAINVGALPRILPVRFVLDGEDVVVRVRQGSTLHAATDGTVVAFEADQLRPDTGWSISFVGVARHLDEGRAVSPAVQLALPRWGSDRAHRLVAISTDQLSGRRLPGHGDGL